MTYSVKGRGRHISRMRHHRRVCKHIFGSAEKPRLVVTRSNRHMIAQLVNDYIGRALASASTMEDTLRVSSNKKVDKAREVGKLIAQRAKATGTIVVVFDRGGNKHHDRVTTVAEGVREGGLSL